MITKTKLLMSTTGLWLIALPAFAALPPTNIPEPSVFSLIIAGGIVGAVIAIRNRRK